ncbi:MAG: hypothetical protein J7L95_02925, partial [Prolixibacteraceae bacterium]|nr:hypothetical protein [Prolixibacteraceae bacterium]
MKLLAHWKEYKSAELSKENIDANPTGQFEEWLIEALQKEKEYPTAMVISTIGTDTFLPKIEVEFFLKECQRRIFLY